VRRLAIHVSGQPLIESGSWSNCLLVKIAG
jgi:hypothetical protein